MEHSPEQHNNEESYVVEPEESDAQEGPGKKDKLKQEIERLKKEKDEYLQGWQRERASMANLRKDQEKHREEFRSASLRDILLSLIQLLDSFELAGAHAPDEVRKNVWFLGISHIHKQMQQILAQYGVEEIPTEVGDSFRADTDEAIEELESDKPSGTVLAIVQKGYRMNGRVLRPVRVQVAQ